MIHFFNYFISNLHNFDNPSVLPPHTKQPIFDLFCQNVQPLLGKTVKKGYHTLVGGPFFSLDPVAP